MACGEDRRPRFGEHGVEAYRYVGVHHCRASRVCQGVSQGDRKGSRFYSSGEGADFGQYQGLEGWRHVDGLPGDEGGETRESYPLSGTGCGQENEAHAPEVSDWRLAIVMPLGFAQCGTHIIALSLPPSIW